LINSYHISERQKSKIRLLSFLVGSFILILGLFNLTVWFYKFDNLGSFIEAKKSYLRHFPEIIHYPSYINAAAMTAIVFSIFFFRIAAHQDQLRFLSIIGILGNVVLWSASIWLMFS
tara:strand:- start:173 stop:523 length:351 start_codon:yes stop_codon:yes gene_type:complete